MLSTTWADRAFLLSASIWENIRGLSTHALHHVVLRHRELSTVCAAHHHHQRQLYLCSEHWWNICRNGVVNVLEHIGLTRFPTFRNSEDFYFLSFGHGYTLHLLDTRNPHDWYLWYPQNIHTNRSAFFKKCPRTPTTVVWWKIFQNIFSFKCESKTQTPSGLVRMFTKIQLINSFLFILWPKYAENLYGFHDCCPLRRTWTQRSLLWVSHPTAVRRRVPQH